MDEAVVKINLFTTNGYRSEEYFCDCIEETVFLMKQTINVKQYITYFTVLLYRRNSITDEFYLFLSFVSTSSKTKRGLDSYL